MTLDNLAALPNIHAFLPSTFRARELQINQYFIEINNFENLLYSSLEIIKNKDEEHLKTAWTALSTNESSALDRVTQFKR